MEKFPMARQDIDDDSDRGAADGAASDDDEEEDLEAQVKDLSEKLIELQQRLSGTRPRARCYRPGTVHRQVCSGSWSLSLAPSREHPNRREKFALPASRQWRSFARAKPYLASQVSRREPPHTTRRGRGEYKARGLASCHLQGEAGFH